MAKYPGCPSCPYWRDENYFEFSEEDTLVLSIEEGSYRPSKKRVCTFFQAGTSVYCSGRLTDEDRYFLAIGA